MQFLPAEIEGLVIIEPKVYGDKRGYFMESFRMDMFQNEIPGVEFVQDNESMSVFGVLRGLHYQLPPFAQNKLVRVTTGKILDVVVDIRKNRPSFGKHFALELSSDNNRQLFIPAGFAHGFVVLSEQAIFQYKVDNLYSSEHERGIAFDDPELGIDWIVDRRDLLTSKKDTANPVLAEAEVFKF